MVFVIGEVFSEQLQSDAMQDVLKTMPLPLAFKLSAAEYDVYLSTRFKASDELERLKAKLSEAGIAFNQFNDTDSYELDDWDIDTVYDLYENDTLVFFSNLGDDTIASMASYGNLYDCKSLLYINKLFISTEAISEMVHCFIEEQFVPGYSGEIPSDKLTVIPNGSSPNDTAQIMFEVIKDIEDQLNPR
ncbi:hypothetical protein ACMGE7_02220 [Macrococcus equi]|uniref:hypothetical protein n=1 Tax=Macrococcus equi TaxID=3395462 RepID=UPI0039BDA97F